MRYLVSLFLLVEILLAWDIDTIYRSIFRKISNFLRSTDIFLSDDNSSTRQEFDISTSLDMIAETYRDTRFRVNVKANIDFPRTQKKLHLFFQDFKTNDSIDAQTGKTVQDSVSKSSFLFGVQYLTKADISYRAGIRIHSGKLDPFVSARWERTNYFNFLHSSWVYYGDRLYYYLDRKWDNTLFFFYQNKLNDITLFSFENKYRFKYHPDNENEYLHSLRFYVSKGTYGLFMPRAEIYCHADDKESYKLNYYYVGIDWRDRLIRRWLFFKAGPAVLWRIENGFKPSFRFTASIGVSFEQN